MKVKLSLLLLVFALMSGAALAQTVAGKWVGELSAADGHGVAQPITVELKLDGATLSGTVTEGALEPRPIVSPAVEGSTVTFRTVRNFGGSDINVNWKGELKGDDLALTRQQGPAPADAAAGGRGGGRGGGGRGGGAAGGARGGARGGAAAEPVPPVPTAQGAETPDAGAADAGAARGAGGRGAGGGGRGGGARGGGAPAAGDAAGGGRGAAAPQAPSVTLTLHRSR